MLYYVLDYYNSLPSASAFSPSMLTQSGPSCCIGGTDGDGTAATPDALRVYILTSAVANSCRGALFSHHFLTPEFRDEYLEDTETRNGRLNIH